MFSELLIHTVQVYARSGRTDRFGQPVDSNPSQVSATPTSTYPCRAYRKTGGRVMQERSIDVFEKPWMIFTETSADIYEDDIVRVVDADGNELLDKSAITYAETVYDGAGAHHKEFTIIEQSGPNPART